MKIRTIHVTLPAPAGSVFAFLAEAGNLPLWATEFCERIERRGGGWIAHTTQGPLHFAIESDVARGTIDLHAGAEPIAMAIFPMRVLAIPPGVTLVMFTFCQPPGLPDELYERQYRSLGLEMRGLAARFGGGELHAAEAAAAG